MLSLILLSMLMILLYSKIDQVSDLWQQLALVSELESDLQDTLDWQEVACFQCWENSTGFVWPV